MTTTQATVTFNDLIGRTMAMLKEGKAEPTITVSFDSGDRLDTLAIAAFNSTYRGGPAVTHTFKLGGERISYRAAELLLRAYPVVSQR
jgi:hypothetical protein